MTSKQQELNILKHIYEISDFFVIQPSEQPDFIITNTYTESSFGVEITQFYYHETSARLKNVPGYFSQLLNGAKPRKGDRHLKVEKIKIIDPTGKFRFAVPAIVSETIPFTQRLDILEACIMRKCLKWRKYNSELTHVNLIIEDVERIFSNAEDLQHQIFSHSIQQVVLNSPFREIYFITTIKEEKCYYPLKAHFVIEMYQLYCSYLITQGTTLKNDCRRHIIYFALWILNNYSLKVLLAMDHENYYVLFANTYIKDNVNDSKGFETHTIEDVPIDFEKYLTNINLSEYSDLVTSDESLTAYCKTHFTGNQYYKLCVKYNDL